jgi:hypothetical protein
MNEWSASDQPERRTPAEEFDDKCLQSLRQVFLAYRVSISQTLEEGRKSLSHLAYARERGEAPMTETQTEPK